VELEFEDDVEDEEDREESEDRLAAPDMFSTTALCCMEAVDRGPGNKTLFSSMTCVLLFILSAAWTRATFISLSKKVLSRERVAARSVVE